MRCWPAKILELVVVVMGVVLLLRLLLLLLLLFGTVVRWRDVRDDCDSDDDEKEEEEEEEEEDEELQSWCSMSVSPISAHALLLEQAWEQCCNPESSCLGGAVHKTRADRTHMPHGPPNFGDMCQCLAIHMPRA